jgi:hypothetical protein
VRGPAQTRRHPHGKFQPPGEGKGKMNAENNFNLVLAF